MTRKFEEIIFNISADKVIPAERLREAFEELWHRHQELQIENRRLAGDNKTLYTIVHELQAMLSKKKNLRLEG